MKKVFITGSSRGLGKALAEIYLSEGHKVEGYSRTCSIKHSSYKHHNVDLSDTKQVELIEFNLSGDFESFILINNAGSLGQITHLGKLNSKEIKKTINLNTITPIVLINKFIKTTSNLNQENFVLNIGTGAASNPIDGWSIYCSSKASLNMLTDVYVKEKSLENKNCKMVTMSPGIIDTSMQAQIRNTNEKDFSNVARFTFYKNNNELASPKEVAKKIFINFDIIFNKEQAIQKIRDY